MIFDKKKGHNQFFGCTVMIWHFKNSGSGQMYWHMQLWQVIGNRCEVLKRKWNSFRWKMWSSMMENDPIWWMSSRFICDTMIIFKIVFKWWNLRLMQESKRCLKIWNESIIIKSSGKYLKKLWCKKKFKWTIRCF